MSRPTGNVTAPEIKRLFAGRRCPSCQRSKLADHCDDQARCTWLFCSACRTVYDHRSGRSYQFEGA